MDLCNMHGGKSTGPRTPEGSPRAAWKHRFYSAAANATRREARARLKALRELIAKRRGIMSVSARGFRACLSPGACYEAGARSSAMTAYCRSASV
jgi:hypothetical protein